ncbi:hypothetical protein ABG79_00965 [Caloramator mitchellensis]|uniref:Uncharacterized protein n=1 Tax=Caloramator mitchellensis TaxID=908809 RepID=A0A0R3K4A4_CALMK|nr:hypothetical protein [Caloramator mitchellensis]KRQ87167.1 hypothetical protein ABG79_00965 [Caloramator mitchellensis]
MGFPDIRTEDIVAYLAKWLKIQEEAKKNVWINGCNNCVKMASEQGPGDQEIGNIEGNGRPL